MWVQSGGISIIHNLSLVSFSVWLCPFQGSVLGVGVDGTLRKGISIQYQNITCGTSMYTYLWGHKLEKRKFGWTKLDKISLPAE